MSSPGGPWLPWSQKSSSTAGGRIRWQRKTELVLVLVLVTLRAKLSGAVYCNRSCLWVCGVCALCVCLCTGSVITITRNCVHRSSPNWVGSDHLQLIKFWPPSRDPGKGSVVGRNFCLRLTTASAQCLRLSERFFITPVPVGTLGGNAPKAASNLLT